MTDPIRSGASLSTAESHWLHPSQIRAPLIVLIHGFTGDGEYLRKFATYCEGYGFLTALFEYDSYLGIDDAATKLTHRLAAAGERLIDVGFALIGHSMGGLVARAAICSLSPNHRKALKGLVTLGTPNAGTLSRELVGYMLDWAESISKPHPFARSKACVSSQQLTKSDSQRFLDSLHSEEARLGDTVPRLSVSGGLSYLETASNRIRDRLQHIILQRLINELPNDGLVGESSADLRSAMSPSRNEIEHLNNYDEFLRINHSYLAANQDIATIVVNWLRERWH